MHILLLQALPTEFSARWFSVECATVQVTDAEMKVSMSEASIRRGADGFASVGGLHKQKEALRRAIVVPLRHPELMRALGARPGRGALLHGPPGSGKTLLAAAIAAEAGVHLEVIYFHERQINPRFLLRSIPIISGMVVCAAQVMLCHCYILCRFHLMFLRDAQDLYNN